MKSFSNISNTFPKMFPRVVSNHTKGLLAKLESRPEHPAKILCSKPKVDEAHFVSFSHPSNREKYDLGNYLDLLRYYLNSLIHRYLNLVIII